jgi:hypothetical protein
MNKLTHEEVKDPKKVQALFDMYLLSPKQVQALIFKKPGDYIAWRKENPNLDLPKVKGGE